MWMPTKGDPYLAGTLVTLIHQLQTAFPDREWQTSPGTGTIGDAAHASQGSASDHNAWVRAPDGRHVVRAIDVAVTKNGPDCEALFDMVNRMYAAHDSRVYPYGYAIFRGRITDWGNPGGYHAQQGDPHDTHVHISVGQSDYDRTDHWPIPRPVTADPLEEVMAMYASKKEFEDAVAAAAARGVLAAKVDLAEPAVDADVEAVLRAEHERIGRLLDGVSRIAKKVGA